jgi:hypothetical protein
MLKQLMRSHLQGQRTRRSQPGATFPKRHFQAVDQAAEQLLAEINVPTIDSATDGSIRGIINDSPTQSLSSDFERCRHLAQSKLVVH